MHIGGKRKNYPYLLLATVTWQEKMARNLALLAIMVVIMLMPFGVQMSPPTSGNSHPSRGSSITQHMSQHKRSQSFNHHLSYNQVQHQQSQKQLLANFANRASDQNQQQPGPNIKGIKEKANWKITNLRPAPSLRPALLNSGTGTGHIGTGGSSLTGSGSAHHSLSLSQQGTKAPPTYEEDALVLRVIEAYCAAYQNNARNTMHSGLEYDEMTPTLRQLFISVRQLQQDMAQVKTHISEERALRNHLQQVLMGHLESYGTSNTTC